MSGASRRGSRGRHADILRAQLCLNRSVGASRSKNRTASMAVVEHRHYPRLRHLGNPRSDTAHPVAQPPPLSYFYGIFMDRIQSVHPRDLAPSALSSWLNTRHSPSLLSNTARRCFLPRMALYPSRA